MKTPEEIKKGLECCTMPDCRNCPYASDPYCVVKNEDALAYIQQLERERDALLEDIKKAAICLCHVCKHSHWISRKGGELLCGKTGRSVYSVLSCGMFEWCGVPEGD